MKNKKNGTIKCVLCGKVVFYAYWFNGRAICREDIDMFVDEFGFKTIGEEK